MNTRLSGVQLDHVPSSYQTRTKLRSTVTVCGLPFSSSITAVFSTSVLRSVFMGSPLVKLICVRAISVAKRVARQFVAHRHSIQRTGIRGVSLPDTLAARGKTLGHWCAGAVGAFYLSSDDLHSRNRRFFCPFEPLNSSQQSCEVA